MDRESAERELVVLAAGTTARREAGELEQRFSASSATGQRLRRLFVGDDCSQHWDRESSISPGSAPTISSPQPLTSPLVPAETPRRLSPDGLSRRLQDALADGGVSSTPLKGPALSERLYGDPGRRISTDLDLLVPPDELGAAVEVVMRLGYVPPTDHVNGSGLPLLHFAMFHARDELPPVELHWRVHWYERRFAQDRLMAPQASTASERHPSPADELLALLLYYARDGFLGLRIATDIATWWDADGAELDPNELGALLTTYPAYWRVATAAVTAAEEIVGIPAASILHQRPVDDLRARLAVRVADPSPTSSEVRQIYADMGLVDGLLMPRRQLWAFVTRQVLLAPEVLDEQARRAAHRRPRHTITHGVGVMVRYAATLLRLLLRMGKDEIAAGSGGKR